MSSCANPCWRFTCTLKHNLRKLALVFLLLVPLCHASASIITVPEGGDLQAAINAAQPGDTIVLSAGVSYQGPFTLPVKSGDQYVTIQSSTLDQLPADQRVSMAQSSRMPKILSRWADPAVQTMPGAHHYRFLGIEFTTPSASDLVYDLVRLGDGSSAQDTLAEVPHHLTFDRCYIHALPTQTLKRGIALNSAETTITNCYIADFKVEGQDSQAIGGWNGPGPFHIINNYLEGAGENILFGGAAPSVPGLIPSDIEVRRNYFFKPLSWRVGDPSYAGRRWTIKNLFELKNARRVVIEGNIFENVWLDAQNGYAILFTCINDSGSWARIEDVSFTNNIVRHAGGGVNIRARDDIGATLARITVRNNLFEDISDFWAGGRADLYKILRGGDSITIDHNTGIQTGSVIVFDAVGQLNTNFKFTNNISPHNLYGVFGSESSSGTASLNAYCLLPYVFARNAIPGAWAPGYPVGNFYPAALSDVGFIDLAGSNYRLNTQSLYRNAGTDGKDLGVDFAVLDAATAGVNSSGSNTPSPTPTPTPDPANAPPSVMLTAPFSNAVFGNSQDVRITASANDSDGNVVAVEFYENGALLGASTTAPYSFTWTRVPTGNYQLTAKAFDNRGAVSTSTAVSIVVNNSLRIVTTSDDNNGTTAALNSMTRKAEVFSVTTEMNVGPDKRTRLNIFATGISGSAVNSNTSNDMNVSGVVRLNFAESVIVEARLSDGRAYRLPVEFAGEQGTIPGLDQVNVILIPQLQGAGRVTLTLIVGGFRSNAPAIVVQ